MSGETKAFSLSYLFFLCDVFDLGDIAALLLVDGGALGLFLRHDLVPALLRLHVPAVRHHHCPAKPGQHVGRRAARMSILWTRL